MFAQERPQSLFVFATSSKRENYQLTVSVQTRETVRHVSSPSLCTVTDLSELRQCKELIGYQRVSGMKMTFLRQQRETTVYRNNPDLLTSAGRLFQVVAVLTHVNSLHNQMHVSRLTYALSRTKGSTVSTLQSHAAHVHGH